MYSNDGLSGNYAPRRTRYPEAAYGFQRFRAEIGSTSIVGFDHLNPQLQERVISTQLKPRSPRGEPQTYAQGTPAPEGARNRSARPFEK